MRLLTPILLLLIASGCQTTTREATPSDVAEASGPGAEAAAEPAAVEPTPESERLGLGQVTGEDLARTIYKAMDAQISKKQTLGEDGEQTTEIGDFESFKFNVTRLGKGKDEVSGSDAADNADVDVTGWYKVSVASKDQPDQTPACTSFDATLRIERVQGDWQVPAGQDIAITREDGEDCF